MGGAGHETTANTLSWALYLLATNPEAQAELHAELDGLDFDKAGEGEGANNDVPSFEDARSRLPLTLAVVYETLRLYPTVALFPRECARHGVRIGGYDVPKGSLVLVVANVAHRDPRFFPEPNSFVPKRFLGTPAPSTSLPVGAPGMGAPGKFAFMPFGAGPRTCVGQRFAILEAVLLLAAIAKRYEFSMPGDQAAGGVGWMEEGGKRVRADGSAAARDAVKEHLAVTLRPVGLRLVLKRRTPQVRTSAPAPVQDN
jgi:cytochrome P450